jgi:UDP-N-acetylmuramyl pentapeptide phosphotransferase/UDP-N-acetylglucosamine-1-phosphate transferase
VLALTTFLNIYNFLDGIDGISCAESIHLSITILILCYLRAEVVINVNLLIILNVIILASCLSFLIFNWHPAKIFLGDIGSIGLGFTIGLCLLTLSISSSNLFIASLIASLYYIADKEKFWQPHLKHFFQQAVRKGMGHQEIVVKIALCNMSLMLLSVLSLYYPIMSTIIALFIVTTILIHFAK